MGGSGCVDLMSRLFRECPEWPERKIFNRKGREGFAKGAKKVVHCEGSGIGSAAGFSPLRGRWHSIKDTKELETKTASVGSEESYERSTEEEVLGFRVRVSCMMRLPGLLRGESSKYWGS
jgi:hypothetical protein